MQQLLNVQCNFQEGLQCFSDNQKDGGGEVHSLNVTMSMTFCMHNALFPCIAAWLTRLLKWSSAPPECQKFLLHPPLLRA